MASKQRLSDLAQFMQEKTEKAEKKIQASFLKINLSSFVNNQKHNSKSLGI